MCEECGEELDGDGACPDCPELEIGYAEEAA
jgi:hypothetical protein